MCGGISGRRAELDDETALLWPALADPTRRRILDLLRDRPRTTGDIASHFAISRIAVMQHLVALVGSGLVTGRKKGRQRWYYLNALPLYRLHERWFDPITAGWASTLVRLQNRVEAEAGGLSSHQPAIDIALDVAIAGTPAAVFAALTEDPGDWWGHPFVRPHATGLTLDRRLGGLFVEKWGNGGAVLASVTACEDDRYLELTGPFHLGVAVGTAVFELAPTVEGTLLRFSFRAIGAIDAEVADQFSNGWNELVARRLKALVESGLRLGIQPEPSAPLATTQEANHE